MLSGRDLLIWGLECHILALIMTFSKGNTQFHFHIWGVSGSLEILHLGIDCVQISTAGVYGNAVLLRCADTYTSPFIALLSAYES